MDNVSILLNVVDKASPELKKFSDNLNNAESKIASFAKGAAALGAALGAAVATGLALLTKNAINYADAIGDASQQTGIATESFSALAYAAGVEGMTVETFSGHMVKLNNAISDSLDPMSKAAGAFKYLGVETKNADGTLRGADAVFKDIASKFAQLPDGANKSAVAMDIFGKAGADLIPLLNSGADGLGAMREEAEKLGLILSQDLTEAAGQFNDTMTKLGTATSGIGLSIAKEVLPTLTTLVNKIFEVVSTSADFKNFARGVGEVFKYIVKAGAFVIQSFNTIGKAIGALLASASLALTGEFKAAGQVLKDWYADSKKAWVGTFEFSASLDQVDTSAKKVTQSTTQATKATTNYSRTAAKEGVELQKLYDGFVKSLEGQRQTTKDLSLVEQTRLKLSTKEYDSLNAKQKQQLVNLAQQIQKENELLAVKQEQADLLKELNAIEGQFLNRDLELMDIQQRLKTMQTAGSILANVQQQTNQDLRTYSALLSQITQKIADEQAKTNPNLQLIAEWKDQIERIGKIIDTSGEGLARTNLELEKAKITTQFWEQNFKNTQEQAELLQFKAQLLAEWLSKGLITSEQFRQKMQEINAEMVQLTDDGKAWYEMFGKAADEANNISVQIENLNRWLAEGRITTEQYNKELKDLNNRRFDLLKQELTDTQRIIEAAAGASESAFASFFSDVATKSKSVKEAFRDLGNSIHASITNAIAKIWAEKAVQMLFGADLGGGMRSNGGGFLGGILGSIFRADGGPVRAGQPYIVGERRAELFVPRTNGYIMPDASAAVAGMSGGNNINFAITAMDSQDVLRAIDKIKRPLTDIVNGTNKTYNRGR